MPSVSRSNLPRFWRSRNSSTRPPIILFDEPTSVLTPDEIKLLFKQINRLRGNATIVFVSHRLEEVLEIS